MVQFLSVRSRILAAVALLGAGGAYAGFLYSTPVQAGGPELDTIRQLSQRLGVRQDDPVELRAPAHLPIPPRADEADGKKTGDRRPRKTAPPASPKTVTPAPAVDPPDSPVQNIALMGVTHTDGEDQAWLVDVSTQEREVVDEGDAAWGFTVKQIAEEQIVLARGTDQFTIRLGEKEIPVNEAPAVDTTQLTQNRRWGGGGGNRNRSSREARRNMMRQMMANRGRSSGGRSSGRSWSRSSSSSSNWNRNRSRNSGGRSFTPRLRGNFGGWAGGRNRNQPAAPGPTSNPQTARRRGGQLVGGADPLPTPAPIANPQTQRRLGTTSGVAFGSSENRSRNSGQNRNGSRRR